MQPYLDKLSRRDWQLGGSALLLVIALLFFPVRERWLQRCFDDRA